MARKRKTKLKKVRLQKQVGGTGPLGGRGRELPPKEFEDAGVPRELPPTATPIPTAAPVPADGQGKTDPNLDSQQQPTETQRSDEEEAARKALMGMGDQEEERDMDAVDMDGNPRTHGNTQVPSRSEIQDFNRCIFGPNSPSCPSNFDCSTWD